jgi:NitT/TauT family transport system permease protein
MRPRHRPQNRSVVYLILLCAGQALGRKALGNDPEHELAGETWMGVSKTDISATAISIIGTLAIWEILTRLFQIPGFILPAPSAIFVEAITRYPLYLYNSWVTFYEMVAGFFLAAVIGVFLAVVIVYSRVVRNMIYPQIVVLQIVPKVAIAPLLLIWAGYGITSKVLLALLVAFFPIVVNMVTGLIEIEEELLDLCRILQSGRWQEFSKVRLPNALPYLFSSLKVASTLSVIGAVIGEFVGGAEGLGHLIIIANTELRTSMAFVSLFCLSILGFVLYGLVILAERVFMPWEKWQSATQRAAA